MTTAITRRVQGPATSGNTRRLTPVLTTVDPWGDTWGSSWGSAWGTPGFSLGLVADNTARVGGPISQDLTDRVSASPLSHPTLRISALLLLEGDESGYLLLEGDAQSGADRLALEGDESAFAIGGTTTKRVPEDVA